MSPAHEGPPSGGPPDILGWLRGGDRRSIGRANDVVALVLSRPALFSTLFAGLTGPDPVVRMRAADAVEKISRQQPGWLEPYRDALLTRVGSLEQQEVRWHVAQIVPRLAWAPAEAPRIFDLLVSYLDDDSKIVQVSAMQALADLARQDATLVRPVIDLIVRQMNGGSPAVRSRGRRLLRQLGFATTGHGSDG